jgi:hypothetical protein
MTTTRTELTLHNVANVAIADESLNAHWVKLGLTIDGTELTLYFEPSRQGLAAWQQLRQGLMFASDYVLFVDRKPIKPADRERAITDYLYERQAKEHGA